MTPVEAGRISARLALRAAAAARVQASATSCPVRVAQFALPALTIQPRVRPLELLRFARAISTGAAHTRLVVNTAADAAGSSETISARSSLAILRIPAYVAA